MDIENLKRTLQAFADERDWDRFHNPKNLAMALNVEAAELLERFQWLTDDESQSLKERAGEHQAVVEEIADIMIYLIRLADKLDVDLQQAVTEKMLRNAEKYPVHLARGNAMKYNRRTF